VRRGKRYRLRLRNASDDIHPLHLHRHSFELTKVAGKSTSGVIKDVVMLGGYQEMEVDFTADQPGLTLFHCHMQIHMDYGFMALLDEAATRRKSGGNRATGFTIFTSPHLARGLFLINRCDVTRERGLHINRAVCLESGHNRCANANRGRRLPQRFRPTPWRSTVFPAKSCIRYFPQIYIFSRLSQPHGPGSSNKRFRSWLRFACTI
jgi:hypothetical protein